MKINNNKMHQKARKMDIDSKEMTRNRLDEKKKVRETDIKVGDKVLLVQKKSTVVPPFNPKPYNVPSCKNNIIKAKRGGKTLRRHASSVKKLWKRPEHLIKYPTMVCI